MLFSKWENSCFHLHIKDCILSMKDLIIKIYCMHSQVGCGLKLSYFHKITLHCFENWTAAYTKTSFHKIPFSPHSSPVRYGETLETDHWRKNNDTGDFSSEGWAWEGGRDCSQIPNMIKYNHLLSLAWYDHLIEFVSLISPPFFL